jgi:DNA damage-binding protein 1
MATITAGTQWNYVVTAQKPTVVTHSIVGNFTAENDFNLILA